MLIDGCHSLDPSRDGIEISTVHAAIRIRLGKLLHASRLVGFLQQQGTEDVPHSVLRKPVVRFVLTESVNADRESTCHLFGTRCMSVVYMMV